MKFRHKNLWFIADTHFHHKKIVEYDNLPFKDVEEHDQMLIHYWNSVVPRHGVVFVLGDFCFGNAGTVEKLIEQLNGHIYFVKGNHDKPVVQWSKSRDLDLPQILDIKVHEPNLERKWQDIVLCHYPLHSWNKSHYGAWHLYGHTHGDSEYDRDEQLRFKCKNVGANLNLFTPISYAQLSLEMAKKKKPSHHQRIIAPNELKEKGMPDDLLGILNELLDEHQEEGEFTQYELMDRVYKKMGEYNANWLWIDEPMQELGWNVDYLINEEGTPYYKFSRYPSESPLGKP